MPPKKADEGEQKGAARFGRVRNNLKMGLLGLPNVGKSSLFNLLTEQVILGHLASSTCAAVRQRRSHRLLQQTACTSPQLD
jgi:tRNA U34 5-carboxymethylaminomethyl modifying GTPase MnmE/TrmE